MTSPNGQPLGSGAADADIWTDTDEVVSNGSSHLTEQGLSAEPTSPPGTTRPEKVPGGAVFYRDTGTLVGVDDVLRPGSLRLRHYQLQVQGQRNQHRMQGWVLAGVLVVIMTAIVFPVVAVGMHWITQDFAQQIISLVLTAALSALGGAVAYAFRGASSSNTTESQAANQK